MLVLFPAVSCLKLSKTDTSSFSTWCLVLKALSKMLADNILIFFDYFLKKIRLEISCDFKLFFREYKTWNFMWIVCLADDSHEMTSLISLKNKGKKIKVSSAAVAISALRVSIRKKSLESRPWWLSWMRRPTGDQEVVGSTLAEVGNILSWRLIMKYFLQSFSPFHWFKKDSCQFLAKECAQYWLTA